MPDVRSSAKSTSRACSTCVKAKAKCVRLLQLEACERCHRLKKQCITRESDTRTRKGPRTTRAAQFEKLESKIESLVNALTSRIDPTTGSNQGAGRRDTPGFNASLLSSKATECSYEATPSPRISDSVSTDVFDAAFAKAGATQISLDAAEALLGRYQRLMASSMPFVHIAQHFDAATLREKRPMLLLAVATVASVHDLQRQRSLVNDFLGAVDQKLLVNGEKSLDMLQGILVLLNWFHPHVFWNYQVTNLLHLAISLTSDLKIDRSPQQSLEFRGGPRFPNSTGTKSEAQKLDEHRALLGVYYFASMVAFCFKRVQNMQFSSYMAEALTALEEARERDGDRRLVQLVRIQQVIDAINATKITTAPAAIYTKAFGADLENLRRSANSRGDVCLQMQEHIAELLLVDASLTAQLESSTSSRMVSSAIDDLFRCASAARSCVAAFFEIPVQTYLLLPFSTFAQLGYAFIAMAKLASLHLDGWDPAIIEEELKLGEVIAEIADRLEQVGRSVIDELPVDNDSFGKWATRLQWLRHMFLGRSRPETSNRTMTGDRPDRAGAGWSGGPGQGSMQQPTPSSDAFSADLLSDLDDSFWQRLYEDLNAGPI